MKKYLIFAALLIPFFLFIAGSPARAQINSEEAGGKAILEKLQSQQLTCDKLAGEDFERLGDYFMGQMTGTSHQLMDNMMLQMMGQDGAKQTHIVMGKRLSGCNPAAQFSPEGQNFWQMAPMMQMMGYYGSQQKNGNYMMNSGWQNMMGYGWNLMGGFGIFGWLTMLLFWILLVLGIITLLRCLISKTCKK